MAEEMAGKTYRANLSQSGTSEPTAVVTLNTFPELPVFSYDAVGQYSIFFPIANWDPAKTTAIISGMDNSRIASCDITVGNISIHTRIASSDAFANDCLDNTSIQIIEEL